MVRLILVAAMALAGCDNRAPEAPTVNANSAAEAVLPADNRRSEAPKLMPLPKDQAELDRLILAGYTPHRDHLHLPGVKSCPLEQGADAVM